MNRSILALLVLVAMLCTQPRARAADNILIVNDCDHDIRLFIRYNPNGDKWRNKGWWIINAGVSNYLANAADNKRIVHKKDKQLYLYGYALNARYIWNSDKSQTHQTSYEGNTFYMLPVEDTSPDSNPDTVVKLTCD